MVELFEQIAEMAAAQNEGAVDMLVSYIDVTDTFEPGTYVPEVHLVVRRVDNNPEDAILIV